MSAASHTTADQLYDPGTHEAIRARFDKGDHIGPCHHSRMDWTCASCLYGQLERSEHVIADYAAALRVRAAAADNLADALRAMLPNALGSEWEYFNNAAYHACVHIAREALAAYDAATTQTKDGT